MGLSLREIEQVFQIGNPVSSGLNKKTLKTEGYPDHLYRIHALQSQLSATEIRFRSNLPPNSETIVAFTAHMAILYMFRSLKNIPASSTPTYAANEKTIGPCATEDIETSSITLSLEEKNEREINERPDGVTPGAQIGV